MNIELFIICIVVNIVGTEMSNSDKLSSKTKKLQNKKKEVRSFDFDKCCKVHIGLAIGYLGWSYCGVQSTVEGNGIENHLISALIKMKLIRSVEDLVLSRCGRTDKSVSSAKQIYGLEILVKKTLLESEDFQLSSILPSLNKILPKDIFVYSIAQIMSGKKFDARFDCSMRKYKYFFDKGTLNLSEMEEASQKLIGNHDFSNLCKKSPNKKNYIRTIYSASIYPCEYYPQICVFTIEANGFLWHQIRYIMAVLFKIGSGIWPSTYFNDLLDVNSNNHEQKDLVFAEGLPLNLCASKYEDDIMEWQTNYKSNMIIQKKLENFLHEFSIKLCHIKEQMKVINEFIGTSHSFSMNP